MILKQVRYHSPDILWVEDLRFVEKKTLAKIGKEMPGMIRLLYHCAPLNRSLEEKLGFFDHAITCTPGLAHEFVKHGLDSSCVYHGFDEDFLQHILPDTIERREDVVFSGSLRQGKGYHLERIKLLAFLIENEIDVSIYGLAEKRSSVNAKKMLRTVYKLLKTTGISNPEHLAGILEYGAEHVVSLPVKLAASLKRPVFGKSMYSLLAASKIVLNNHGSIAGEYAGNMRLFEATGAGACLLTDNKSNIGDLFIPGEEIVVYNDSEDCAAKIRWLLENEPERAKIAAAGQKRTLKSHTVSLRCEQIFEIIMSKYSG